MSEGDELNIFEMVHLENDLDELVEKLDGGLSDADSQILQSCAQPVKSVLIEREYIDKDYRSAYSGYYSKKFSRSSSRTIRIHLFCIHLELDDFDATPTTFVDTLKKKAKKESSTTVEGTSDGYVGYLVLRPTEYSRIGRCLVDPRRYESLDEGHARGCLARFKANVMGHDLSVFAFPHQSQDAELHICAHTAVWSLFRYLSQRYPFYKEQYPYDIALLNTDLKYGRLLPGRGLYMDQITAMFGQFGLSAEMYVREMMGEILEHGGDSWAAVQPIEPKSVTGDQLIEAQNRDNVTHLIHTYISSGMPPVVGVPNHAVTAMGIEYSQDPVIERPGRIVSSTDFVQSVLINDDNYAPYRKVQRATPLGANGESSYTCEDFDSFVSPLPEKVYLTAEKAEVLITDLLKELDEPFPRDNAGWSDGTPPEQERFVRHLYCTSSKNYKSFRRRDEDEISNLLARYPLPHFVWIGEFSPLSLWNKTEKSAVLEIVLDATAGPYDSEPYLWIRHPWGLVLNRKRILGLNIGDPETAIYDLNSDQALTFSRFDLNLRSL